MANLNNIDGTISTTNSQILAAGLNIPAKFNNGRTSGELAVLYNASGNAKQLYNKYSYKLPYNGSYKIGDTQSTFQWGLDDVKLIKSWQFSRTGGQFAVKQTLLQGLNAFNETKLYNPAMPIIGATSHASLGLVQGPTRFIEPNLGGVMGGLGLQGVSSLLDLDKPSAPQGTVAAQGGLLSNFLPSTATTDTLPSWAQNGVKGLIRGNTATNANKKFNDKWVDPEDTGLFGKLLDTAGAAIGNYLQSTAFGTFFPAEQPGGTHYKVGEKSYRKFLKNKGQHLFKSSVQIQSTVDNNGLVVGYSFNDKGDYVQKYTAGVGIAGSLLGGKPYVNSVYNYSTKNQGIESSPLLKNLTTYTTASQGEMLAAWDKKLFTLSNFNSTTDIDVIDTIRQLNSLLNINKNKSSYTGINNKNINDIPYTITSASYVTKNYNELSNIKQTNDAVPEKYNGGYSNKLASNDTYSNFRLNQKGLDTNTPDSINLLEPLSSDNVGVEFLRGNGALIGMPGTYSPESDDIIAFYFYDVVNDKYIPFRATVKGIQESLQSNWEEIKYINRADKLYTYGGFTRTLNFNFSVVITSIKELLPTWKRINYFAGLAKPANYTDGTIYSRFIVPPLIKFNIGDMYKNQPAVITQIGITIPEDASWETMPENYDQSSLINWKYLNGRITFPNSWNKFAQFPNQCEITVNMNLLEKELPHTGGSNFGDYYYKPDMLNPATRPKSGSFSSQLYMEGQVKKANDSKLDIPTAPTQAQLETARTNLFKAFSF